MPNPIATSLLASIALSPFAMAQAAHDDGGPPRPAYQGGGLSWKPGSGITIDGGDAFSLNLRNQLQVQWSFTNRENAADANNFTIRRARTKFSGHVFDRHTQFELELDAADTGANIKEGWVHYPFLDDGDQSRVALRMGQTKPFFGLEGTGSSSGLFFVERSSAARGFSDTYTRGAWLHGMHAGNTLRWTLGAMNGDVAGAAGGVLENGEEASNPDNAIDYVASVSCDPLGTFAGSGLTTGLKQGDFEGVELVGTVGGGVFWGNHRDPGNTIDIRSREYNVNTAWRCQRFHFLGEAFFRSDAPDASPDEDTTGYAVQGGYILPRSGDSDLQWGFGIRWSVVETDDTVTVMSGLQGIGATAGKASELSAVIDAFHHGHSAKTQLDYTWQDVDPDTGAGATNHIVRLQVTLLF